MKLRICFFLLLLFYKVQSQNKLLDHKKDSLYQIIFDTNHSLEKRIESIGKLNEFRIPFENKLFVELDSLLQINKLSVKLRINLHHFKGIGHYRLGELSKAEKELQLAYNYYKSNKVTMNTKFIINLGLAKEDQGNQQDALKLYLEAQKIYEKEKNFTNLGHAHIKLGDLYRDLQNLSDAKKHYQLALIYGQKTRDYPIIGEAIRGNGIIKSYENDDEEAAKLFFTAIAIFDSIKHLYLLNDTKCYLAPTYDNLGKMEEANILYQEAIQYFNDSGYEADKYYIAIDYGNHYIKRKQFKKAIDKCTYGRDNLLKIGDRAWAIKACTCLYQAAKQSGDHKTALSYFETLILHRDTLNNEKNIQKITELKKDFEFDKEKEMITLENDKEMEKEKIFQRYLILGLLLLGSFLYLAYRGYIIKSKAHRTILQQNEQLEKYNETNENLIYTLSHDIKEPMMSVQFLLNKIKSDDTYVDKAKNSINDQISNINTIVSNLLQLKKTVGTDIEEILSNEVIYQTGNQIISELNYKIKEKQIQVTNNILNTSEVTLPLSTQKLYITLLNLITNAINYSSIGGQIELYTKPDGIYIRDFGTGIDPNIIDKIGQQHIDKIDTSGGSGMGLLLVSSMLADSKLKLKFENLQDGGTLAGVVINKT